MSVTRLGVSALNVVATIDRPASHQGTARPEAKNSEVLRPARRPKNKAGPKQISSEAATMSQSRRVRGKRGARGVSEVGADREPRRGPRPGGRPRRTLIPWGYGPRRARVLHRKARDPAGSFSVPQVPPNRRVQHPLGPSREEGPAALRRQRGGPHQVRQAARL